MPLTFAGALDRGALGRAAETVAPLVASDEVARACENTSIRDDFNEMAGAGHAGAVAALRASAADLAAALAAAGPTTYVPWQDCCLATDDFLVVRLMELVVHADDLASSLRVEPVGFDDDVLHPVLALLAVLGARRHGQVAAVRALSRAERADGPAAAF